MANVHRILIEGRLPYNIVDNMNEGCLRMFARFGIPCWGFRIEYGKRSYEPVPETGGKLTYYDFKISGSEAVQGRVLVQFCKDLKEAGALITRADAMDTDGCDMPVAYSMLEELEKKDDKK